MIPLHSEDSRIPQEEMSSNFEIGLKPKGSKCCPTPDAVGRNLPAPRQLGLSNLKSQTPNPKPQAKTGPTPKLPNSHTLKLSSSHPPFLPSSHPPFLLLPSWLWTIGPNFRPSCFLTDQPDHHLQLSGVAGFRLGFRVGLRAPRHQLHAAAVRGLRRGGGGRGAELRGAGGAAELLRGHPGGAPGRGKGGWLGEESMGDWGGGGMFCFVSFFFGGGMEPFLVGQGVLAENGDGGGGTGLQVLGTKLETEASRCFGRWVPDLGVAKFATRPWPSESQEFVSVVWLEGVSGLDGVGRGTQLKQNRWMSREVNRFWDSGSRRLPINSPNTVLSTVP